MKPRRLHGSWNRTSTRPNFSDNTDDAERKSLKFSFGFGCPRSSLIYELIATLIFSSTTLGLCTHSTSMTLSYCVLTGHIIASSTRPDATLSKRKLRIPNLGGRSLPVL